MAYAENGPLVRWVATQEDVLEPALPIVDPHHHLWDLRGRSGDGGFAQKLYLCEDFVAELQEGGHNVLQTVFMQCNAFHRAGGPAELQPVGETEFANGVAAMSASGAYGATKICAGIISTVDLSLGAAKVDAALRAHIQASPNFRGIRAVISPEVSSRVDRKMRQNVEFTPDSLDFFVLKPGPLGNAGPTTCGGPHPGLARGVCAAWHARFTLRAVPPRFREQPPCARAGGGGPPDRCNRDQSSRGQDRLGGGAFSIEESSFPIGESSFSVEEST